MNLQKSIRRILKEGNIPTETEYLGWVVPKKLYDELKTVGVKIPNKESDKVYVAEIHFDTKYVVFEIVDSFEDSSFELVKIGKVPKSILPIIFRRLKPKWVDYLQENEEMSLQESIKKILREESSIGEMMKKQIHRLGLYQFMKITGLSWAKIVSVVGVDFLSYKMMAEFIPSALKDLGGFWFDEHDMEPIIYDSKDNAVMEISFLGVNGVGVDVYSGYKFETHEEFRVPYYNLSDDILAQVFDIVMKFYEENR